MIGLLLISVGVSVFAWAKGFNDQSVELFFYWTYAMVILALIAIVFVGGWIGFKNDKKSLVKVLCVLVGAAALCLVVYLLSPGKPAVGIAEQPSASTLRLTDTILNLTYVVGAASILAIIVGEVVNSIRNKKRG